MRKIWLKFRIWMFKRQITFMTESIRVDTLCLENWISILSDLEKEKMGEK